MISLPIVLKNQAWDNQKGGNIKTGLEKEEGGERVMRSLVQTSALPRLAFLLPQHPSHEKLITESKGTPHYGM